MADKDIKHEEEEEEEVPGKYTWTKISSYDGIGNTEKNWTTDTVFVCPQIFLNFLSPSVKTNITWF